MATTKGILISRSTDFSMGEAARMNREADLLRKKGFHPIWAVHEGKDKHISISIPKKESDKYFGIVKRSRKVTVPKPRKVRIAKVKPVRLGKLHHAKRGAGVTRRRDR